MKNILFYTNIPSPYRVDFFNDLGKYCNLTVLFEASHSTERDDVWKQYHFDNFHGIIMRGKRTAVDAAFCPEIIQHLREKHYDEIVISVIASLTSIVAVNWLNLHHIPYIYEGDGGFVHKDNIIKYALKWNVISHAQTVFSTSAVFDEYCIKYGAKHQNIVRYPFSSVWRKDILSAPLTKIEKRALKTRLGIVEEHILISVGQMIYRKGFDILLRAAENMDDSWGIYLIGGTPEEDILRLESELKLKNIHYVEFMPKNNLWEYYRAADLFVLPTREDPWGLVVNEAMANALPVVTTMRCAAGLEMIEDGKNGCLYMPEDWETLKSILISVAEGQMNLSQMAVEALAAANRYTIENMTDTHCRYMDILN